MTKGKGEEGGAVRGGREPSQMNQNLTGKPQVSAVAISAEILFVAVDVYHLISTVIT